jgi:hypothetical protein
MPIGPSGEPLPYGPGPMNPGMGAGPGPDLPPQGQQQMPPIEAVVARIQELEAELSQLISLAEQMGGPGMGGQAGPDLPPGIPQGGPPMPQGPPGLLG